MAGKNAQCCSQRIDILAVVGEDNGVYHLAIVCIGIIHIVGLADRLVCLWKRLPPLDGGTVNEMAIAWIL